MTYKTRISEYIKYKRGFELEQILNEIVISNVKEASQDDLRLYHELRMNIIHAQIFLAKFFKWKDE